MTADEQAAEAGTIKIRAFLALKSPAEWDTKLAALQSRLKGELQTKAFRWVRPEQIHITLRFFGWITPGQAEEIARLLPSSCAVHQPFTLRCEGLGCFPNARRPRIFWASLRGDLPQAAALQSTLTSATGHSGEPPEARPFKPHLTLARIQDLEKRHLDDLENVIARGFVIDGGWNVEEVHLMQSHLSAQGAHYEMLTPARLGGPPP